MLLFFMFVPTHLSMIVVSGCNDRAEISLTAKFGEKNITKFKCYRHIVYFKAETNIFLYQTLLLPV